jgi:uncharacterized OB-fold protein
MSLKCLRCGEVLTPDMEACPSCGSRDRLVEVQDSVQLLEMTKVRQKAKGYHKFKKELVHGEKIGRNGKLAREKRIIDKEAKRKIHVVEVKNEEGEWVIVHKEDEPL